MILFVMIMDIITINKPEKYYGAAKSIVETCVWMVYVRALRESWKRILLVVWRSLAILTIILAYVIFMSLLAYTLFHSKRYNDPDDYFKDIPTSIFNMIILFTTSNFPDIIFPFFKVSNGTALFFITFLFVGLYMLLNLLLAVFYNSYKNEIEKKIYKYDKIRNEFLENEF